MDVVIRATLDAKAKFIVINEHIESIFNAARASKLVFQEPANVYARLFAPDRRTYDYPQIFYR